MNEKYENMYDREKSRLHTVFRSYIVDDGWNPPKEIVEEMVIELKRRMDIELKRVAYEHKKHIGKWINREIMDQYSARAWIYRVMYDYQYVKEIRRLGEELRCEYGMEEIEAINIVLGNEGLFSDYANKYYRIENLIPRMVEAGTVYEDYVIEHEDICEQYGLLIS